MLKNRPLAAPLFACWMLLVSSAAALADERPTAVQLMRVWGIDATLRSISAQMQSLSATPGFPVDEKLKEAWQNAARTHLSPERLEAAMAKELTGLFSDAETDAVVAFLGSPLGQRVTVLERQSSDPALVEVKEAKGPEIWQAASEPRKAILQAIAVDLNTHEGGVAMTLNAVFGLSKGMQASGKLPAQMSDDEVWQLVLQQRAGVAERLAKTIPASMAFTYQTLSDAELSAYADYLGSDIGKAVHDKVHSAFDAVLTGNMRTFGNHLMIAMGRKKA